MPKLKNQPKYVTILQLSQDYHKKVERLVKTVSSSGHLYSANQTKGLIQRSKIRRNTDPVFQLPAKEKLYNVTEE